MSEQPIDDVLANIDALVAEFPDDTPEPEPEVVAEPDSNVVPLRPEPPKTGALAIRPDQRMFDQDQEQALIAQFGLGDAPIGDVRAFFHLAQARGLDPFSREIYLIGRKSKDAPRLPDGTQGKRWTVQTGIDGFRHLAERTGQYRGRTVEWCGEDGNWRDVWLDTTKAPSAARVGILREGMAVPIYGIAAFHEFVPTREWDGKVEVLGLWSKMPAQMLAKVAEAQAIRAAFPRQAAGLYVNEEMHQVDQEVENTEREAGKVRRRAARERADHGRVADAGPALNRDVIQGTVEAAAEPEAAPVVEVTHDALMAEITAQAAVLDKPVAALHRRWAATNQRNVEDATVVELVDLVRSMRGTVGEALRTSGRPAIADRYAADTAPVVDLATLLAEPDVITAGHTWQGDGTDSPYCIICGGHGDDAPH